MMPMLNLPLLRFLAALALFVFLLPTCKDKDCTDAANPDCPNYDPCLMAKVANAEFVILDSLRYYSSDFGAALPVDTMWTFAAIHFRALHENDTYEWKVGTDNRVFTQREFKLDFYSDAIGNIPVRLITTRKSQPDCISGDDGRDTFYRNLFLVDYLANYQKIPIFGSFKGYNEDQKDSVFTIKIFNTEFKDFGIYGFPKGCYDEKITGVYQDMIPSWKGFVATPFACTFFMDAVGRLQPDNKTLIIDYNTRENSSAPRVYRRFIGIKQ